MIFAIVVCFCLFMSSVTTGGLFFYTQNKSSSSSSSKKSTSSSSIDTSLNAGPKTTTTTSGNRGTTTSGNRGTTTSGNRGTTTTTSGNSATPAPIDWGESRSTQTTYAAPAPVYVAPVDNTPPVVVVPTYPFPRFTTSADTFTPGTTNPSLISHRIDCNSSGAINKFQLDKNSAGQYTYKYACATAAEGSLDGYQSRRSAVYDFDGPLDYRTLKNLDITCGPNEVLSHFVFNDLGPQITYDYSCKRSKNALNCEDGFVYAVDVLPITTDNLMNLPVACPSGKALSEVKFRPAGTPGNPAGKNMYTYKCCFA